MSGGFRPRRSHSLQEVRVTLVTRPSTNAGFRGCLRALRNPMLVESSRIMVSMREIVWKYQGAAPCRRCGSGRVHFGRLLLASASTGATLPPGVLAQCNHGTYSFSQTHRDLLTPWRSRGLADTVSDDPSTNAICPGPVILPLQRRRT